MTAATTTAKPAAAGTGGGRRYALLLALWDSEYASKVYGGYYSVFVAAFGGSGAAGEEGGERWDCFRVIAGEFPAPEDLASYDGFVVSGSPHDSYADDPWIARLCALIRTLHAMDKRVLGICFGHQVSEQEQHQHACRADWILADVSFVSIWIIIRSCAGR